MEVNTFNDWLKENEVKEVIGTAAAIWGAKKAYDVIKKRKAEKKAAAAKKKVGESSAPSSTVGSVGGGMVGEPPGPNKKKKKCEIFAGYNVYEVSSDVFLRCKGEKGRYDRYVKHVGDDEAGQEIREYGLKNPGRGIIIKDSKSGSMVVLRNGKGKHKKW